MLAIPTCAFSRSSSVRPIPYNMAWAAGCVGSCVMVFEYLFSPWKAFVFSADCSFVFISFVFMNQYSSLTTVITFLFIKPVLLMQILRLFFQLHDLYRHRV